MEQQGVATQEVARNV